MTFDYVLTDADIGTSIGPVDGFLVDLSQTSPPTQNSPPQATPAGVWTGGNYLQLRGEKDYRDLYCAQPATAFMNWSGKRLFLVVNHSLPYRGQLAINAVPKGSTFAITLSDVELTWREKNERAKAMERKALEAMVAEIQRKAETLAPAEPAAPPMIEGPDERERVPVMAEVDKPKTPARRR
jgi:hypothetical protein